MGKFLKELMIKFPEFFSEGLEKCTKTKAIFKLKRMRRLLLGTSISKKLDCLEQIGMLTKTDYSEWACSTVHMKKKQFFFSCNQLDLPIYNRACTDFLQDLTIA